MRVQIFQHAGQRIRANHYIRVNENYRFAGSQLGAAIPGVSETRALPRETHDRISVAASNRGRPVAASVIYDNQLEPIARKVTGEYSTQRAGECRRAVADRDNHGQQER
jgi:hypothetical protein